MSNHLAILMGTYQGAQYLPEQLQSIEAQTYRNWSLWISDDGSTDRTREIVDQFRLRTASPVHILSGPGQGFLRNFMSLVSRPEIDADFYGFSDQDDLWHPDKVEHALGWLASQCSERPALFCSRTRIVDSAGRVIGFSPHFRREPSFANSLVQSIAGGNTMIMNRAARDLIIRAGPDVTVPSHDWWSYILVSGAGGSVRYDPVPKIDYRQHESNQVGSNSGMVARLRRFKMLKDGRFKQWNEQHVSALQPIEELLTSENRQIFQLFQKARTEAFPRNIYTFIKSGMYRQTVAGNVGLTSAVLLRQI